MLAGWGGREGGREGVCGGGVKAYQLVHNSHMLVKDMHTHS